MRTLFNVLFFFSFQVGFTQGDLEGYFISDRKMIEITLKNISDTIVNLPNLIRNSHMGPDMIERSDSTLILMINHVGRGPELKSSHMNVKEVGLLAFEKLPPDCKRSFCFLIPKKFRKDVQKANNIILIFDLQRKYNIIRSSPIGLFKSQWQ